MPLTKQQRRVLEFVGKHRYRPPTGFDLFRSKLGCLTALAIVPTALALWTYANGYPVVSLCVLCLLFGFLARDWLVDQESLTAWSALLLVVDWDRVDQLLAEASTRDEPSAGDAGPA